MFQYLEGSQFFAWNCAPFLVALSSFATYTTIAGGILDSQTAFVSLTLFNTLRGPLFLLPFGIAAIIQGNVALKRINTFLNAEELDQNSVRNLLLVHKTVFTPKIKLNKKTLMNCYLNLFKI